MSLQVTELCVAQRPDAGRIGPAEASVQSPIVTTFHLCFCTELIHINSNFFSFVNVPTPLSVHHHVYVS